MVGICKPESYFMSELEAKEKVSLDNAIIMPHVTFGYKAKGDVEAVKQGFLTGGCLNILE